MSPAAADPPAVGDLLELDVGAVAHGGHCVGRVGDAPGGRVVFIRHALPGERVRAKVTEDHGGTFCRADAVEVLRRSPDRVDAPCVYAAPERCGGCDWQHARPAAQRALKAQVVREQFARLARLDVDPVVEELPGGPLGWRTRISYAIDDVGRPGLRRHRSHSIELIESCLLGVAGVGDSAILDQRWLGESAIEVARDEQGSGSLLAHRPVTTAQSSRARKGATRGRPATDRRRRRPPDEVRLVEGQSRLHHRVGDLEFEVAPQTFWQVHPAAAATFSDAVLAAVNPRPGEVALDLYAGAGLFTAALAAAVGPAGKVLGVESSRQAVIDAEGNLHRWPWARIQHAQVTAPLLQELGLRPDVVVLDPPRSGAGEAVIAAVIGAAPRLIAYVSCDPASLARDVKYALGFGWNLAALRAFDAFPMTHHVECIALLAPA